MASASTWVRPFQFGQRQLTAVAWWGGRTSRGAPSRAKVLLRARCHTRHFGPNRPHTRRALDHLPSPALGPPLHAAPCLCRNAQGEIMSNPPLIRAITKDPVLSKVGGRLGWIGL